MKGSRSGNINIQKAFMKFSLITACLKIIFGATAQENSEKPLSISPKKLMHSISPFLSRLMEKIFTGASAADFYKEVERCCKEVSVSMQKSKASYINRMRGQYIGWIIDELKRPPIKTDLGAVWENIRQLKSKKRLRRCSDHG